MDKRTITRRKGKIAKQLETLTFSNPDNAMEQFDYLAVNANTKSARDYWDELRFALSVQLTTSD